MKALTVFLATALLGTMCWSCGGGTARSDMSGMEDYSEGSAAVPTAPVRERGGDSVTARLGPPGGTLELANGARIEIPPGTVDGAVEVVLKVAPPTTAFKDEDVQGQRPVGPLVLLTPELWAPEGGALVVSIPFSSFPEGYSPGDLFLATEEVGRNQRAFAEDTTVTRWEYQEASVRGDRAVAEVSALSGMRLQFVLSRD